MARLPKYPAPSWVLEHMNQQRYNSYVSRMAVGIRNRDLKRGGAYTPQEARDAVHAAIVACGGRDHWTGEPLRWDQFGQFDSDEAARRGGAYKRELAMKPTIDHRDNKPEADFVVCAWRTNDSKHDMTIDELVQFCRAVLHHQGAEAKAD